MLQSNLISFAVQVVVSQKVDRYLNLRTDQLVSYVIIQIVLVVQVICTTSKIKSIYLLVPDIFSEFLCATYSVLILIHSNKMSINDT